MKKFLALILALAMIFALAACGQSAAAPAAQEAAPAAQEAAPAEAAKEITINFPCIWVGTDSKAAYFAEMVDSFNKENEGQIKVVIEEQTDYQAYRDKIRTLVTAGEVPDICTMDTAADVELYTASGKFMDFTPYLDGGWRDTFATGTFDSYTYDGVTAVIPFESAIFPIVYNVEILKEAGWETYPANWDEMFEMFDDIKAAGYNAVGQMAGENAWTSMLWYSALVQAIGGKEAFENGLSDPAFVEAADVLKRMYDYTFDGTISAGAVDVNGHWIAQDTALYLNGPWWIGNLYKEDNAKDGVLLADVCDVAANPEWVGGKGQGGLVTKVQSFILAAKQDDPAKEAAVVKFLQYITDPDRMQTWSASAGSMFFVNYEPSEDTTVIAQKFAEIKKDAAFTVLAVDANFGPAYESAFPAAVSALVLGQVDAQGFVDQLQTAIDNAA